MENKIALSDDILEYVQGGSKIPYIIQSGDTLGKLADKFHVSIEDICKWNNIADPNVINAGQKLIFKQGVGDLKIENGELRDERAKQILAMWWVMCGKW